MSSLLEGFAYDFRCVELFPYKRQRLWLARMCLARVRQALVPGPKPSLRRNSTTTSNQEQQQQQRHHGDNMSFDQRPDQPLPEPPTEDPPSIPTMNGERTTESSDIYGAPLPPAPVDETSRVVDDVLYSDVCNNRPVPCQI